MEILAERDATIVDPEAVKDAVRVELLTERMRDIQRRRQAMKDTARGIE